MKIRKLLALALTAIIAISAASCSSNKVGVNILEQPEDFTGEFDMPSSKKLNQHNALWVLTQFNENGFKIKSSIKTSSSDESVIESYRINIFDVNTEVFLFNDTSERLQEIKDTGKFIIKGQDGTAMAEYPAYANGHFALMITSDLNYEGKDVSADNAKLIEYFKSLELN